MKMARVTGYLRAVTYVVLLAMSVYSDEAFVTSSLQGQQIPSTQSIFVYYLRWMFTEKIRFRMFWVRFIPQECLSFSWILISIRSRFMFFRFSGLYSSLFLSSNSESCKHRHHACSSASLTMQLLVSSRLSCLHLCSMSRTLLASPMRACLTHTYH